jgi:hypothetical protein
MKTLTPEDPKLQALLREARPMPDLPLGFQNSVWRRIEQADAKSVPKTAWLEALVAWLLRPRHALVGATALVLVGITIGVQQGDSRAHEIARERYVNAVSPIQTR